MSIRGAWEELFHRFDPKLPAAQLKWHTERPLSPAGAVSKALNRPFGVSRVLMTGTTGTGKTTELLHIAEGRARKEFVVFLDLVRHFEEVVHDISALQRVSPWEICFLSGLAILRAAQDKAAFFLPNAHLRAFENAWKVLAKVSAEVAETPELDAAKLAQSMVLSVSTAVAGAALGPAGSVAGMALSALGAVAEAGSWSIPLGRDKRELRDQEPQVQSMLQAVNVIIGLVQQRVGKVLLVIDGLDRIRELQQAKALFLNSQMISQMDCAMVVCGPFVLRTGAAIGGVQGFSDVPPVVNIPVLAQDDPLRPGPGIPFFLELFRRRVADMPAKNLVEPRLLQKMAYYSGGRVREFVGFIQRLGAFAWDDDVSAATEAIVDAVLDERRRMLETGMTIGQIRLLESIARDPLHGLPDGDMALGLLENHALLPYPDGNEWYYPHPLLTISRLRVRPTGSSS